jgi:hypothetical protein
VVATVLLVTATCARLGLRPSSQAGDKDGVTTFNTSSISQMNSSRSSVKFHPQAPKLSGMLILISLLTPRLSQWLSREGGGALAMGPDGSTRSFLILGPSRDALEKERAVRAGTGRLISATAGSETGSIAEFRRGP